MTISKTQLVNNLPYTLILAALLGSTMPIAFAPLSIWPLGILLPALLVVLADTQHSLRRVILIGWVFGLGYFGFGVYWLYNSLHDFGNASPPMAAALAALMIICISLFPALTLVSWKLAQRVLGQWTIWLLPLLWFAFEWLKGWILTGFPWLSLGYSQVDSPLHGFAPFIGVYGLSAVCVLLSVALIRVVRNRQYLHIALVVLIPGLAISIQNIDWTEPQSTPLRVTIVQGNIPQEIKWQYDQRQNIFDIYWRETNKNWDSDLIVWPETAIPGRSENIEQSVLIQMSIAATQQGSSILTGVVVSESEKNIFYNSMLLLGSSQGAYHKRHLVMFGEYYPLRWLLDFMRSFIDIPYSDLTSGSRNQPLMSVNETRLGVSICFENVFSRDIMTALPEANLLVNASNDAWFGDSLAPHQHLQIAQMRALETGRPMVRSTNTGISAFIDYRGRIIESTEQFKTQSITRDMVGRMGVTPFYYFARVQGLLAALILVVLLIFVFRFRSLPVITTS
ncbi:MAG: apolipoprotein N-acyltransferase [Gammaproteobacteria bacterium]